MLIQPNEQGWSTSNQGPWQLIFNDHYIIKLFEVNLGTSTQEKLFIGTKEECEAKIAELGLPLASNDSLGEIEDIVIVVPPLMDEDIH
jgi:hypothetical protein